MKSRQVDFSRVRSAHGSVSVDTSYIEGDARDGGKWAYFETAAKDDTKQFVQRRHWSVLEQYNTKDQALAGHQRWAKKILETSLSYAIDLAAAEKVDK